jgi:hypothetical protein
VTPEHAREAQAIRGTAAMRRDSRDALASARKANKAADRS